MARLTYGQQQGIVPMHHLAHLNTSRVPLRRVHLGMRMRRWKRRIFAPRLHPASLRHRGEQGQSVVEFSMIIPVVMMLLVGIGDLGRVYTTIFSLEAAAREAADFGAFSSSNWLGDVADPTSNAGKTVSAMTKRACVASSRLTDYVGAGDSCTNPTITVSLQEADGTAATDCADAERTPGPCWVRVDIAYEFDLITPLGIDVAGIRIGLPDSVTIERTSIFANSDFEIDSL